ncbi:MAG: NTP transferase domain-containing protein [Deltaproteobacteria bacterium]|nr:NTP transferase domain-containing protein [Deltaproteobacteria bacterium]
MTRAAVVLAAGAGSRLGGLPKALLMHGERSFLELIVDRVREGGPVIVVVGPPFGDAVADHARTLGEHVHVVVNPEPARGMASSIALGFDALQPWSRPGIDDAWLWPVDHPFIRQDTLEAIGKAMGRHDVARPVFRGSDGAVRGGHPPLISRRSWLQLAGCDRVEGGARAVISTLDVVDVPVDDPGVVRDIDTPEDREALS